jgi:hypothetical protein
VLAGQQHRHGHCSELWQCYSHCKECCKSDMSLLCSWPLQQSACSCLADAAAAFSENLSSCSACCCWCLLGTWDSIGVFPGTTTSVASFYAARAAKNSNSTGVAVEINGGCRASYTISTGLTLNNAGSGLSCSLLGMSALVALVLAFMM